MFSRPFKLAPDLPSRRAGDVFLSVLSELTAEVLSCGAGVRMRVSGTSMGPLIRSGDAVVVAPTQTRDLKPGDLIFFVNRRRSLVLHRILKVDRRAQGGVWFRTKGDSQGMFDEPVEPLSVLGRVVRIERSRHGLIGRIIDLDSPPWRRMAPALALAHLGVNRLWSVAMRLQGRM